jgi:hypothetical protein
MATTDETQKTAQCTKCKSEIPVDADRCRECGYEPGPGILGGIVMWVSGMIGSTFLVISLVSLIVILDGFPVVQGLTVAGFTGFIAAVFLGIVYAGYKGGQRKPTDEPLGTNEESKSMGESWNEGRERGERWAEQINTAYYTAVHALPSWLWTVGVLLGCVLSLSVWPAALQENEAAMSVGIIGGGFLLFLVIIVDSLRLNDAYDELNFRWWFWSILAFVPLIGWLFGLTWLWRRQSKINDVTTS